ncbi:MAG: bifunctional 3-phosphoshikimate 1-carboxyvinyltransferase/cytidylate kinase [Tepidimonas sp.]|uniref:bifunctional 3-phosphoshikimate 1-carboxyvinyltransferase/cytidylate kinase n=1 Tax=Tepidimonas sp. TaxID=2002775 RepID=UPI00259E4CC1|nr:bifunctional 3-phosphoshikimate 1-carboxyvinyltransferase/cytidylate kinase [Tepidimonas sp.]MDM7455889.1 bifunctional 3-phosphoshikimate 1-carboxyvinyltransferase/cytidylate kinase [Tepidimonas sp.]
MYRTAFLDIPPLMRAAGSVRLPGSKSISNRVLLLAALCDGVTVIEDLLDSDDTRVMLEALATLGCGLERLGPTTVRVRGLAGRLHVREARLFLGNAGTAMRPLTAALTVLTALQGGRFELSGVPRMHERPIGDLVDALRQLGGIIEDLGQPGYPPLAVGARAPTPLQLDAPIRVRGDVSSQFLTALLLALPLAAQTRAVTIEVVGELISKPYIEITLRLLARFGVDVQREGWSRFTIPAGAHYSTPGRIHVEGDASSASYFIALGAIAATDTPVTIEGVGLNSIQGDIRFVEAARAMGALVEGEANRLHVRRGAWPLRALDLDCNHIPDAAMTLAVMALYADGPTTLRHIGSWRVKETDRIAAMAAELRQLGATVEEGADWLRVHPLGADGRGWRAAAIRTYDDHRMAMCASLAAFNPARLPVRILDPQCVGKTFPDYFETLWSVVQAEPADIPVICIDGPTASGKGTLAAAVAQRLGYHVLDSGALYRVVGLAAERAGLSTDEAALADPALAQRLGALAEQLPVRFADGRIWLAGDDVTDAVRSEAAGMAASRVSAVPAVRAGLLALQRGFRRLPGLVADGRDMGTVVFPDAPLKVFLTASAATRAQRRREQLILRGVTANIDSLLADLEARDARDRMRAAAPLKPAEDALTLDNSEQTIEQSVDTVLAWWQRSRPFGG